MECKSTFMYIVGVTFFLLQQSHTGEGSSSTVLGTFKNPILDLDIGGSYVYLHTDNYYYMTVTLNSTDLYVYKSNILSNWRLAERKHVYTAPSGILGMGQSEIHFIQNQWFIYFQMHNVNETMYMYGMQAENPANPLGRYTNPKRLSAVTPEEDNGHWDGTILQHYNNRLYFIYAGRLLNGTLSLSLFIAEMKDPLTINGTRICIREYGTAWDLTVVSPHVVTVGNRTNLLFSTSSSSSGQCVGLMGIDHGMDPLVPGNWWHHTGADDGCVFRGNEGVDVLNPGYPSVTTSPDLKESWLVYRAQGNNNGFTPRIDKFTWNVDHTPQFLTPTSTSTLQPLPSGEN